VSPTDAPDTSVVFVDSNVFLRFFTNDVPEQAAAAEALFRQAATGAVRLITSPLVLAEIVWVLESYYHLARPDVEERVMAVALMEGLELPEIDLVTEALSLYLSADVDFIDAYNASWMRQRGITQVVTFDAKHYARLEGIETLAL
jgi:uncharacterized protein